LRYQVLGLIELSSGDGSVRLGGPKQRAVLALLLLNANRVVSERQFLAMVWGDDPPLSVRGQLQMYVSQLRKLIGEPVIMRRPPGYLIQVRPGELDLDVFDEAVRRAEPRTRWRDSPRRSRCGEVPRWVGRPVRCWPGKARCCRTGG
jgi:DNA-binding SARP family transcriptional activator